MQNEAHTHAFITKQNVRQLRVLRRVACLKTAHQHGNRDGNVN